MPVQAAAGGFRPRPSCFRAAVPRGQEGRVTDSQPIRIVLSNLVFGRAHLLDLHLPAGWVLQRGFSNPEIHASHTRRGVSWVVAGDAWYVLRHDTAPWMLEFHLQVRARPYARPGEAQQTTVAGHTAWWRFLRLRRGLPWRRRETPGVELAWYCPVTERAFRLRAVGRVPAEIFPALLHAWQQSQCHRAGAPLATHQAP